MPPKKKAAKKEADATDGPNIYMELAKKPVSEIDVNLELPDKLLSAQNNEFQTLVDRLQQQMQLVEADNARLRHISAFTSANQSASLQQWSDLRAVKTKDRSEIVTECRQAKVDKHEASGHKKAVIHEKGN